MRVPPHSSVPPGLAIRVLHSDEDVVVISKPCNLRSVPGHANRPPPDTSPPAAPAVSLSGGRKRRRDGGGESDGGGDANTKGVVGETNSSGGGGGEGGGVPPMEEASSTSHRRTTQEAWIEAIKSFGGLARANENNGSGPAGGGSDDDRPRSAVSLSILRGLAASENRSLASVPRKPKPFTSYCRRNRRRLLCCGDGGKEDANASHESSTTFDEAAREAHAMIRARHVPLLNLPEGTRDEQSAWGQLKLLGYGGDGRSGAGERSKPSSSSASSLRVVHRLDCETSGVMVFARTEEAASSLSQAWRERDRVQKLYVARVARWPPSQDGGSREGAIELPLAKAVERLKWEVRDADKGGKESKTLWKIWDEEAATSPSSGGEGITLSLTPFTGRTHQLRVHCAAVGSGIEGDSLYGEAATAGGTVWDPTAGAATAGDGAATTLKLHAHKLSFPHPRSGETVSFEAPIPWL